MKKYGILLAGILLSVSVLSVQAQNGSPQPPTFEELDTNGDGELTRDELKGPLLKDLEKFDADGSGRLSESEIPEPPQRG